MKKEIHKNLDEKELNQIHCENIFDELFKSTEFEKLESSKKFEILSAISVMNKNNINFNQAELDKKIVFGDTGDLGVDSMIMSVNKTAVTNLEEIEEISRNTKWSIELILNQSKFNKTWPTNILHRIGSIASQFIDNSDIFKDNPVWSYNQEVFQKILEWMPLKSSLDIQINICNIGNSNEIIDNEQYKINKKSCEMILSKVETKPRSIKFNEVDFEWIIDNYKSRSIEKTVQILEYFDDSFNSQDSSPDACITLLNLAEYINLIEKDENLDYSMFEDNVRDYQNETAVNKEIIKSFNEEKCIDFWWLNNGVTILVEDFQKKTKFLILKNPQIINGLQSSYSLYNAFSKIKNDLEKEEFENFVNNENRKILVKVIKKNNDEQTNKIIAASNTQNPMNYATLRANSSVLKTLERDLIPHDIYLERRKNYYKNRNKPKNRIIATDYVAKTYDSIIKKNPCVAKNRTIIYFREKTMFESIFNRKNRKILIQVSVLYSQFINNINEIDIEDSLFNKENIEIIKTHFKYHAMSIYWTKFGVEEFTLEKLKSSCEELILILNNYKSEIEPNLIEKIVKVSTYTDFQKFMYEKIN